MTTVSLRASSLAELFDCPARWEAKHLRGLCLPSSGAAHLGTAIHAGTAAFDKARLDHRAPISLDAAAGALVDTLYHPEGDVDWADLGGPHKVETVALTLHARYCLGVSPYRQYLAVEAALPALEVALPSITLVLTGTTDRVRRDPDGKVGITDLKSGRRAVGEDGHVHTRGHGPQIGVYELLAENALGMDITAPGEIVGLQTTAAARVGVGRIESPRLPLLGTEDRPGLLEMAGEILAKGLFFGNTRSYLCTKKYCPIHPCNYV